MKNIHKKRIQCTIFLSFLFLNIYSSNLTKNIFQKIKNIPGRLYKPIINNKGKSSLALMPAYIYYSIHNYIGDLNNAADLSLKKKTHIKNLKNNILDNEKKIDKLIQPLHKESFTIDLFQNLYHELGHLLGATIEQKIPLMNALIASPIYENNHRYANISYITKPLNIKKNVQFMLSGYLSNMILDKILYNYYNKKFNAIILTNKIYDKGDDYFKAISMINAYNIDKEMLNEIVNHTVDTLIIFMPIHLLYTTYLYGNNNEDRINLKLFNLPERLPLNPSSIIGKVIGGYQYTINRTIFNPFNNVEDFDSLVKISKVIFEKNKNNLEKFTPEEKTIFELMHYALERIEPVREVIIEQNKLKNLIPRKTKNFIDNTTLHLNVLNNLFPSNTLQNILPKPIENMHNPFY